MKTSSAVFPRVPQKKQRKRVLHYWEGNLTALYINRQPCTDFRLQPNTLCENAPKENPHSIYFCSLFIKSFLAANEDVSQLFHRPCKLHRPSGTYTRVMPLLAPTAALRWRGRPHFLGASWFNNQSVFPAGGDAAVGSRLNPKLWLRPVDTSKQVGPCASQRFF